MIFLDEKTASKEECGISIYLLGLIIITLPILNVLTQSSPVDFYFIPKIFLDPDKIGSDYEFSFFLIIF